MAEGTMSTGTVSADTIVIGTDTVNDITMIADINLTGIGIVIAPMSVV
jgi:hypothetical protein